MRTLDWLRFALTTARTTGVALLRAAAGGRPPAGVALEPGDPAPDFRLPGSDGRTYQLSQYRGRQSVVLAWFPKAFTPGCAAECRSLQSSRPDLEALGVRYFAISTDNPATNQRFAASLKLDYPILSDADGSVARAFGVLGRSGFPARWTFVIALDGRITAIDKAVATSSHGRDLTERVRMLGRERGEASAADRIRKS